MAKPFPDPRHGRSREARHGCQRDCAITPPLSMSPIRLTPGYFRRLGHKPMLAMSPAAGSPPPGSPLRRGSGREPAAKSVEASRAPAASAPLSSAGVRAPTTFASALATARRPCAARESVSGFQLAPGSMSMRGAKIRRPGPAGTSRRPISPPSSVRRRCRMFCGLNGANMEAAGGGGARTARPQRGTCPRSTRRPGSSKPRVKARLRTPWQTKNAAPVEGAASIEGPLPSQAACAGPGLCRIATFALPRATGAQRSAHPWPRNLIRPLTTRSLDRSRRKVSCATVAGPGPPGDLSPAAGPLEALGLLSSAMASSSARRTTGAKQLARPGFPASLLSGVSTNWSFGVLRCS